MAKHRDDQSAATALLDSLAELGYGPLGSVWDLPGIGRRYKSAVPVLVSALEDARDERQTEGIVRALSVPWATEAVPALIQKFRAIDPAEELLRWAIGNALEVTWDDAHFEDLAEIAKDRSFGSAREMVVLGLGRSERDEARRLLIELLDDKEVTAHAIRAISRLRVPEARPCLERLLHDDRPLVRKEAAKALAKMEDH